MTAEVSLAIEELRAAFPGGQVSAEAEAQGGAYVTVTGLDFGASYNPSTTWIGFLIGFQYPRADVYPHFMDPSVKRVDGQAHGVSFQLSQKWRDKDAIQVSRRSNRLDPTVDTAATKLAKVLEWVRTR